MTKRIVFAVMCALLVLVIVMSCIVFNRFGFVFELIWNSPDITQPSTSPTVTEPSDQTDPTETTQPTTEATQPTETTVPTEPTETTAPTEPPHEHTYVKTRTVAPGCTTYGYSVYTCSCGKTDIPEDEMKDPIGHNYVAGDPVKATCTTAGSVPYTCTNCQDRYASKTEDALGHNYGPGKVTPPTCTEDGFTAYTCVVCRHEEKQAIIEASGHSYEQWILIEEATDTKPGSEKSVCTACGEEEVRQILPTGEIKITNGNGNGQVATKVDENGAQYRHYIIIVGTQEHPNAYQYTVEYHVVGGVLKYVYALDGLTVTYQDKDGQEKQIRLEPYCNGKLVILSDGSTEEGTEDPVQPTDPTQPTNPTDPTDPTQPTDTTGPSLPTTTPTQPTQPETTAPTQPETTAPTQPETTAPTQPETTGATEATGGAAA